MTLFCGKPRAGIGIALLSALLGCAPSAPRAPQTQGQAQPAVDFQDAHYRALAAHGQEVLRIDPQASLIAITVRRSGTLARLGHDHLIASRNVEGWVAPGEGRADVHFRLDQLSVDEAGLRDAAGLDHQPSSEAIEGTRSNMLNRVLEAARFPHVLMHVTRAAPGAPLSLSITLHGVTRTLPAPATIARDAARHLVVSGTLSFNQSDFGLVPFAVLGGAIAVQDRLEMRFRIVAVPPED
ncbi:hypothetical protein AAKU55_004471 [Oxalobacteraceae bacterium GrIS 1.11]